VFEKTYIFGQISRKTECPTLQHFRSKILKFEIYFEKVFIVNLLLILFEVIKYTNNLQTF
jgi:hypothetical protein